MRKRLFLAALALLPTMAMCQVDEIVNQLRAGKKVTLHKDSTYDFTPYEMIPVSDSIIGNGARIIHNRLFQGATGSNLTSVFLINTGAYLSSIRFEGANGGLGTTVYTTAQCMLQIIGASTVESCSFTKCDKWAINVKGDYLQKPEVVIRNCYFDRTQLVGFGYAIWVKDAIVRITGCVFQNNRHAVDGSNKFSEVYIDSCEFYSHYIPVHQHEYTGGIYGFRVMSIRNSTFYTPLESVKLKLPFSPTDGYVEVINCRFMADSIKAGTIADQPIATFTHPQFKCKGNTWSGVGIPAAPVISATLDSVPVSGRVYYSIATEERSPQWSNGAVGKKVNRVFDRPDVYVMKLNVKGKPYGFKTCWSYETGPFYSFWLLINGFGTAYVYRDEQLIYTIPYSKATTWKQFVFRGQGIYKVVLKGSPTFPTNFFIDDVSWKSDRETFEGRTYKTKFTYDYAGDTRSMKLGAAITEFRSGAQSLYVTIPADHPGSVIMK